MYLLGVLCLLWGAVALPTPEQLHTNVPALPSPELKPDEKDKNNLEEVLVDPIPNVIEDPAYLDKEDKEKFDEPKKEPESLEKPKEDEEKEKEKAEKKELEKEKEKEEEKEVKDKIEDHVKVIEESNDPKEKPNEEQPKEEKKDEEPKDEEEDKGPILVEIFKPKPFFADIFSQIFPGFQWPHFSTWPDFFRPKSADPLDDPVYIVREADISWP